MWIFLAAGILYFLIRILLELLAEKLLIEEKLKKNRPNYYGFKQWIDIVTKVIAVILTAIFGIVIFIVVGLLAG